MNLIFIGAPGVGKGTIAALLSEKNEIPHISTGDIFRTAIAEETPLGLKVNEILAEGLLVSDEITNDLVRERLQKGDIESGFILDGYPRTIPQAEALRGFIRIDKVILFNLDQDTILKRLGGRRNCPNCGAGFHVVYMPSEKGEECDRCGTPLKTRPDDLPEAIQKRLAVYEEQTAPLIKYYREKGELEEIDASPNPETIVAKMQRIL